MRLSTFVLFCSVLMFGCEKELDLEVPFKGQKLVINAFNNPDSIWLLQLSLTRHVLDTNYYFFQVPRSAVVTIVDPSNDAVVDVLTADNLFESTYKGTSKPEPGKEYRIRVVTSDYGTAEATCVIPHPVPITKIEIDSVSFFQSNSLGLKIYFKDPPAQKNFYNLNFLAHTFYLDYRTNDTIRNIGHVYFEVGESTLIDDVISMSDLYITDTFFDGDEHTLTVRVNRRYFDSRAATSLHVVLSNITEPYYQYMTTSKLQANSGGDPFAQPVQVYNNVQNGFGIFAGYSQSVVELVK
jgi:Domain of unknown function (DUF4249)